MNFRDKIIRFMYGRNGFDDMCKGLVILYFIILVINAFPQNVFLYSINLVILVYVIFRTLSKDIASRSKENSWYLSKIRKFKPFFYSLKRRISEIRTHRYRHCPMCKAELRLPRKTGKHGVICPRCKHKFDVNIWF